MIVLHQKNKAHRIKINLLIPCMALSFGLAGCSWTDKGGTHRLIIGLGFGLITTTNRPGVDVYDARILGGEFGPDGVGLGWMHHHRVEINPAIASNVVISVKAGHWGISVKNFDPYGSDTNCNPIPITTTNNPGQP
jgi:hypothetical protein